MEALRPAAAHHDGLHEAFGPKPSGLGGGRFSSSPNLLTYGADPFCGGGSPHPFGRGLASTSPRAASRSPDTGSVVDEGDDSPAAAERLARLELQYQVVANCYQLCFSQLANTSDEAVAIRQEIDQLRFANANLMRCIAMVGGHHSSAIALANEFRGLTLSQEQAKAMPMPMPPPPLPVPVVMQPVPAVMPKSISVRSPGYTKSKMSPNGKHRASRTKKAGSQQRVFVGTNGGAKGEDKKGVKKEQGTHGMEFEVYHQGMFKTELCNKWEETGACSYGNHCQFAHGIAELRPIIRHPRYKTEVCRMVLAGTLCPYSHRCHFRHSITPADYHQGTTL